ncbi:histidine phosphatase family protein [Methylobacterium sp. A54F]
MSTIFFIRHGQTDWNAEGRLQGQRDTPLNALGEAQAAEAAERLRRVAGDRLAAAAFVASPLTRTRRTMEIVRASLDLPREDFGLDPRLKEISFGAWEGLTWAEIRRRDPAGAAARDRNRWSYRPPGAGAESYAMLTERVAPAVAEFGPCTVVVAHGGVARAILVARGHLQPAAAPRIGIRQGAVLVLEGSDWYWA